jgi:hypothetical protein
MAEAVEDLLTNAVVNIAQDMKDTMESIAAVFKDAEKQSVTNEQTRLWLKRLKNAAQGISDMMDNYQDQSAQQVRKLLQAIGITLIYAVLRPRIDEHELRIYIRNIVSI